MPMPDDPTPALLASLNQNINALRAAMDEVRMWLDDRGAVDEADNIAGHLQVIDDNADSISVGMADLVARWKPEDQVDPED